MPGAACCRTQRFEACASLQDIPLSSRAPYSPSAAWVAPLVPRAGWRRRCSRPRVHTCSEHVVDRVGGLVYYRRVTSCQDRLRSHCFPVAIVFRPTSERTNERACERKSETTKNRHVEYRCSYSHSLARSLTHTHTHSLSHDCSIVYVGT